MADDPFSTSSGSAGAGSINAAGADHDRYRPAVETMNRQPSRPSWNPVEEARRQAELKAATAAPATPPAKNDKKPAASKRSTPVGADGDNSRSRYHTLLPRIMVIIGLILSPVNAVIIQLLERTDHALKVDGATEFDATGRLVFIAVVGGSAGLYLSGWVWWTAAAAANARMKTRRASSPSFPALAIFALAAFIVVAVRWGDRLSPNLGLVLIAGIILSGLAVAVGIPLSFRRSAAMMSAPSIYWTRMLLLPLAACGVTLAATMANVVAKNGMFVLAAGVLNLFISVWFMVNIVQAMASFDRATKVPNTELDSLAIPEFLRR